MSILVDMACEKTNRVKEICELFADLLPRKFFHCLRRMLPYVGICSFLHKRKNTTTTAHKIHKLLDCLPCFPTWISS